MKMKKDEEWLKQNKTKSQAEKGGKQMQNNRILNGFPLTKYIYIEQLPSIA